MSHDMVKLNFQSLSRGLTHLTYGEERTERDRPQNIWGLDQDHNQGSGGPPDFQVFYSSVSMAPPSSECAENASEALKGSIPKESKAPTQLKQEGPPP